MVDAYVNCEQKSVILHKEGPMLVVAGAGSGKTRVVSHRVQELLNNNIPANKILVITFTNKACSEIQHRVGNPSVCICTFHRLGLTLIKQFGADTKRRANTIYDRTDSISMLKTILLSFNINASFAKEYAEAISCIKHSVTFVKNELQKYLLRGDSGHHCMNIFAECFSEDYKTEKFKHLCKFSEVYIEYLLSCSRHGVVDLDDLIYLPSIALEHIPAYRARISSAWDYVIVDEYQDTSDLEVFMLRHIIELHLNIMVVGDPNQSIYEWRGANRKNILDFAFRFPAAKVIKLFVNYRSSQEIVTFANDIIKSENEGILCNNLKGLVKGEKPILLCFADDKKESEAIAEIAKQSIYELKGDMAIIYRTNSQSKLLESALLNADIPYSIKGSLSLYDREEIKTMLAWLCMISNDYCNDYTKWSRAISFPKRGIGSKKKIEIFNALKESGKNLFEVLEGSINGSLEGNSLIKFSKSQSCEICDFIEIVQGAQNMYKAQGLGGAIEYLLCNAGFKELFAAKEHGKSKLKNLLHFGFVYKNSKVVLQDLMEKIHLREEDVHKKGSKVTLATIHSVKGLEFDTVVICGLEQEILPHKNAFSVEEERRLFYVAATRAKIRLMMTVAKRRFINGTFNKDGRISEFMHSLNRSFFVSIKVYSLKDVFSAVRNHETHSSWKSLKAKFS